MFITVAYCGTLYVTREEREREKRKKKENPEYLAKSQKLCKK